MPTSDSNFRAHEQAADSSYLDSSETTVSSGDLSRFPYHEHAGDQLVNTFRHSGWKQYRRRLWDALRDDYHNARRAARLATCGCSFWLLRNAHDPTLFRKVQDFCHDRWCVPCARSRANRIAANLLPHLEDTQLRFATLTLATDGRTLKDRITRLLTSFTALRKRPFWPAHVDGGAAFLEVTKGATGDHWHPHLHLILQGTFLPQALLRDNWLAITGDSHIVDIRTADDHRQVARYVTSYVTKPAAAAIYRNPADLREAIYAMRGRKLLIPFGTWRSYKLLAHPTSEDWTYYGHVCEIMALADGGDDLALAVLLMLELLGPRETDEPFHVEDLIETQRSPPPS